MWRIRLQMCAVIALAPCVAHGQVDKDQFHLFNPAPRELMRDLSPDRPDGTESPRTVDAGHFQIEMSFVDYTHDNEGDDTDTLAIADTNLKLGLTNRIDLQVVFQSYTEERVDTPTGTNVTEGFSDVTLRLKVNLWGNDAGDPAAPKLFGIDTAFGVMPFVKIPTDTRLSNGHGEGGFIAALALDVADHWGVGFMAEIDAVYDEDDDDYDGEFVHTAVVGFDVTGPLGAYVEYIGVVSTDKDSDYEAIFSGGLTWRLNRDTILDVGTRLGLTEAADDVVVFTGLTWRY